MARESRDATVPTLHSLQQPEKLSTVLERDKSADCLPCRIMGELPIAHTSDGGLTTSLGASAFIGLGAYSYFSGKHQLRQQRDSILKSRSLFGMKARQAGITGIASVLVGLGVWRLIN